VDDLTSTLEIGFWEVNILACRDLKPWFGHLAMRVAGAYSSGTQSCPSWSLWQAFAYRTDAHHRFSCRASPAGSFCHNFDRVILSRTPLGSSGAHSCWGSLIRLVLYSLRDQWNGRGISIAHRADTRCFCSNIFKSFSLGLSFSASLDS
jgi:hypothetical protein